jgi:acetolactate synthase-1/2/3 large subunit
MLLTGGEVVAEQLVRRGVPYLAGIPGHGCLALLDAFQSRQEQIGVIQVRHEQSAVHLADGFYRVSGKPLAVFTSIGPGAANTVVGLATAYVDSTAALVICGDVHTHMFGRGVLQEVERHHWANLARVFEPVTKRCWQINRVEQLPSVMNRAFSEMLSGRRGPVAISLPMDIQAQAAEVEVHVPEPKESVGRTAADPQDVAKAAELLLAAERPVILAGGGVLAAEASGALRNLAEHLGAAVITTFAGKSAFPEDHPLYGWHAGSKGTTSGNYLARTADVLLAVGCRFADETTSSFRHGVSFAIPPTKLIHADVDPGEIGKNYPTAAGLAGDARSVLGQLAAEVGEQMAGRDYTGTSYFHDIQRAKEKWLQELSPFRDSERVPVTISRFIRELRAALDRDAIVVTSAGHPQAQVLQEFAFYAPRSNVTSAGFSTMGFALPAAIGAKLAAPNRQVVGVVGDGDFMMTMQELATAVQHNVPVVMAVLNNFGWQSIRDLQISAFGPERVLATEFQREGAPYSPDFCDIGRAFGCHAERIQSGEEVGPALARAFQSGRPSLIEVLVAREHPYSGGLVTGWWDVPVPAYLEERRATYERERSEERLL